MTILAIDCDLRQSYGVTSDGKSHRADTPREILAALRGDCTTILFEIASPTSFMRGGQQSAVMYNLAKWALWNMHWASWLDGAIFSSQFLVSPSDKWTKGHNLAVRHAIAGCKQPKKDLRECEAMIWTFNHEPTLWVPLSIHLQQTVRTTG